jgi:CRP/FNR family transcriptional regulator, cyclic AMP receptor protein
VHRLDIFTGFDKGKMELLKPLFKELSFPAGTVIFQQGETAEFLYLVINGTVDMSFKPYDGMPITVSHVGKGGLFGWSAVVGSEKYTSSAIAIGAVNAFQVRGSELREFCIENPEAGKTILERLADRVSSRWKDSHKQVQSILFQGLGA